MNNTVRFLFVMLLMLSNLTSINAIDLPLMLSGVETCSANSVEPNKPTTSSSQIIVLKQEMVDKNFSCEQLASLCDYSTQGKAAPLIMVEGALYEVAEYLNSNMVTMSINDIEQLLQGLEEYCKRTSACCCQSN